MSTAPQFFIKTSDSGTTIALLEDDAVRELRVDNFTSPSLVGNVYRGKVRRVLPDMQAAFVDLGLDRPGFLHRRDIIGRPAEIAKVLHEGQSIIVQVTQDPRGEGDNVKGATLSNEVRLVGSRLVWLPTSGDRDLVLSKNLKNISGKTEIAEWNQLFAESHTSGTLIVRSASGDAKTQGTEILRELAWLQRRWALVQENHSRAPVLLMAEISVPEQMLRECSEATVLWADEQSQTDFMNAQTISLETFALRTSVATETQQSHYSAMLEAARLQQQSRIVALSNGGEIILDRTEAMWVIDVNTASATSRKDAHHETNLLAAEEIARQLRLRDIGGIVVIDFIDEGSILRKELIEVLETALGEDSARTTVGASSSLGLVEVSRQYRFAQPQSSNLNCPTCQGRGIIAGGLA